MTRNAKPNQTNSYLPFDPAGAMLGPLGVLALVLGSKKKKSKYDVLLFVMVFAITSGFVLTACSGQESTFSATITPVTTPAPSSTQSYIVSATATPTNGGPTEYYSAVVTGTPNLIPTILPDCATAVTPTPIDVDDYITFDGWTDTQKDVAMKAIRKVSERLLGDVSLLKFFQVYNISTTPSTRLQFIKKSDAGQNGCAAGPNLIKCHPTYNFEDPRLIVHELGHLLHQNNPSRNLYGDIRISENAIVDDLGRWVTGLHPRGDECRDNEDPNSSLGIRCAATNVDQYGSFERTFRGYTGDSIPHVYHGTSFPDWRTNLNEDYADMFMNWTYNTFNDDASAYNAGTKRYEWMEQRMSQFIG